MLGNFGGGFFAPDIFYVMADAAQRINRHYGKFKAWSGCGNDGDCRFRIFLGNHTGVGEGVFPRRGGVDFSSARRCAAVVSFLFALYNIYFLHWVAKMNLHGGFSVALLFPPVMGGGLYFLLYWAGRIFYPRWKAARGGFIVLLLLPAVLAG